MHYGIGFWKTPEHFYQAMKTNNKLQQKAIANAKTPGEAKRLGRKCTIRPDWEKEKIMVMEYALRWKFRKGTELNKRLLETKGEIIEWNTWHDNEWGNCQCSNCLKIPGNNLLGKLLMKIRLQSKLGIDFK